MVYYRTFRISFLASLTKLCLYFVAQCCSHSVVLGMVNNPLRRLHVLISPYSVLAFNDLLLALPLGVRILHSPAVTYAFHSNNKGFWLISGHNKFVISARGRTKWSMNETRICRFGGGSINRYLFVMDIRQIYFIFSGRTKFNALICL